MVDLSGSAWIRDSGGQLWRERGAYVAAVWARGGNDWRFVVRDGNGRQVAFGDHLGDEPQAMLAGDVALDALCVPQKDNRSPG